MSIENAAREICNNYDLVLDRERIDECRKDIAEIIRRHLFPVVKPEEVEKEKFYWVKSQGKWAAEIGGWIVHYKDVDEIRGPVPCPVQP